VRRVALVSVFVALVLAGCGGGDSESSIKPGQVYAARDHDSGGYHVLKILYVDQSVVVSRRYVNLFDEPPADVPANLRLGMTVEDFQLGEIGVSWGAVAIDASGFAADVQEFILLGEQPVTDEERENAEDALKPT
jgi:hypothetical protein